MDSPDFVISLTALVPETHKNHHLIVNYFSRSYLMRFSVQFEFACKEIKPKGCLISASNQVTDTPL